jgi:hypothetical protein
MVDATRAWEVGDEGSQLISVVAVARRVAREPARGLLLHQPRDRIRQRRPGRRRERFVPLESNHEFTPQTQSPGFTVK